MKLKVSETTNIQLDWLVAKCEGFNAEALVQLAKKVPGKNYGCFLTNYSTNWSQGGPIIDREHIGLISPTNKLSMFWTADIGYESKFTQFDHDPLVAAMRCFVASRLGDEVEVPDELGKEG